MSFAGHGNRARIFARSVHEQKQGLSVATIQQWTQLRKFIQIEEIEENMLEISQSFPLADP